MCTSDPLIQNALWFALTKAQNNWFEKRAIIVIGASIYTAFAAPGTNIFAAQPQTVTTGG